MRDDMAKMLVETHRTKPTFTYKKKRRTNKQQISRNADALPSKEGMTKPYGYETKEFGENFPPLIGYLRKNVGRPWDKVYSELSKSLKGGGAVIAHVYVHLWQFVERNPIWVDGWPCSPASSRRSYPLGKGQLYVDRRGFLREVRKSKPAPKGKMRNRLVEISQFEQYRRVDGIWYHVWFKMLPSRARVGTVFVDVLTGHKIVYKENSFLGGWNVGFAVGTWPLDRAHGMVQKDGEKRSIYAVRKVQIGKQEIRQAGLNSR